MLPKTMNGILPTGSDPNSESATPAVPAGPAGSGTKPVRPSVVDLLGPQGRRFLLAVAVLTLVLVQGWIGIVRGAIADALFSYTILIPFISGWLVWQRPPLPRRAPETMPWVGSALLVAAAGCAMAGILAQRSGAITSTASWLSTQIAAWVIAVGGLAALFLGKRWLIEHQFAVAFLVFTIPIPDPLVAQIEYGLQIASASASEWMFALTRTPYVRNDMAFWLPGVHIQVAPECSGIRSTLVLFITAVLGSYLLLRHTIHRAAIVLAIVPLGIFRNALRILTLTLLSVYVNPEIMHSALHRRGGPLFFAVSLVPLFAMFWWFGRRERSAAKRT